MYSGLTEFVKINSTKANFDAIYSHPDPREYFRVLCGLDYVIPDLAKTPFRAILNALRSKRKRHLKIADLGCSYGINSALLRYPLDIQRLALRYVSREMQQIDSTSLAELDRNYFRSWPLQNEDMFIGIDTSKPAIEYALRSGLIDGAVTTNLEEADPAPGELPMLRGLNLLISTGCIGYTTQKSIRRILSSQRESAPQPWIASLVLRMFPYDAIAEEISRFGLVTEKLEGVTFVQRRFHSEQECKATLETLEKMGVDPAGKENEGLFHAELYVSRPRAEVESCRLSDLVSVTSGAGRRYGRRYRRNAQGKIKLMH
jgi:hypothetical protein